MGNTYESNTFSRVAIFSNILWRYNVSNRVILCFFSLMAPKRIPELYLARITRDHI